MPQFSPDQVSFGDLAGYGAWDVAHAREHIQFTQVFAQLPVPIVLPSYDLLTFLTGNPVVRASTAQAHSQTHLLIHAALGISGVDMAASNLDDQGSFYDFLGYHSQYHAQIRQALGLT